MTEYKPIHFVQNNFQRTEYLPNNRKGLTRLILDCRLKILYRKSNKYLYFHARHNFSSEEQKSHDLSFLSHYMISHPNNVHASLTERFRHYLYERRYFREIHYVAVQVRHYGKENIPIDLENYVRKWQPYTNPEPFMVEFFHGLDLERRSYWFE